MKFFTESISSYNTSINNIFFYSNKITNLLLFIFWTGSLFLIDERWVSKYRCPSRKQFDIKLREFFLLFQDKYQRRKSKRNKSKQNLTKVDSAMILNEVDHSHLFPAYSSLKRSSHNLPGSDFDFFEDSDEEEEDENDITK